ncbi:MAG TPA: hypothetical protein VMH05_07560 [Bryobacteraceae bacterium]|nr:hypothetical protein [Bryobacteraceae bacterium]
MNGGSLYGPEPDLSDDRGHRHYAGRQYRAICEVIQEAALAGFEASDDCYADVALRNSRTNRSQQRRERRKLVALGEMEGEIDGRLEFRVGTCSVVQWQ